MEDFGLWGLINIGKKPHYLGSCLGSWKLDNLLLSFLYLFFQAYMIYHPYIERTVVIEYN